MRNILLIGAGKSTRHLIQYLIQNSEKENLRITIACLDIKEVFSEVQSHPKVSLIELDITNEVLISDLIQKSTLVISMLPAHLHIHIALQCLTHSKNLITASYISPELNDLHQQVVDKELLFLNEMGLDPGLDHMSSMKLINTIKKEGGKINSYQSYCGGLIAPESDTNAWNYKFTWNPRNVVLAGQGPAARYLKDGELKFLPYHQLFKKPQPFHIDKYDYEGYPNRNSLQYINTYQLDNVHTMIRGTLRKKNFIQAWDIFVQLGLTEDHYTISNSEMLTPFRFISLFLHHSNIDDIILAIENTIKRPLTLDEKRKFNELNFNDNTTLLNLKNATPAQLLEAILIKHWKLNPEDKDLIVMNHLISYTDRNNTDKTIQSQLIVKGENNSYTAMSKTVGLPLGIGALMLLNKQIPLLGVQLPIDKCIYNPILDELKNHGIIFKESIIENPVL